MKNKLLLLMFIMFQFGFSQLWNYDFCSILGSNSYGPMNSVATANATNRTAIIYPASELISIAGQELTSIYFYRNTATGAIAGSPNFKVYMKEVSFIDWGPDAVDWATITSGAVLVYDSNPASATGTSAGWKEFEFSTNFIYSGTQNLAIFYEYTNATASSTIAWRYEYLSACMNTSNNNTTKYTNNTTGALPPTLSTTNYRRAVIGFDFLVSCNAPTNLVSSNLTNNSIDFSWTAGNAGSTWEYAVLPGGSGIPTTGLQTTTTANLSLTGLTPDTNYTFFFREVCGVDDKSVWVGPINFTTLCLDASDFIETFEGYGTGSGNMPICWNIGGTSTGVWITTSSVAPMSPSNRLNMNTSATNEAFALLPPVSNLQANTHRLKFKAYCTTTSKNLSVGYLTNPADVSTFQELALIALPGTLAASALEFTVIPTSIPAGVKVLAFRSNNGLTTTLYIDDVKWEVNSACPEPTNLSVVNLTENAATIGIVGTADSYDIQYGLSGFSFGTGTILSNITTLPAQIPGLTANTTYQVYVRANCATESSSWTLPISFTTQCAAVTEFTENFDSYPTTTGSMPDCWYVSGTSTLVSILGSSVDPMSPPNRLRMSASATTPTEAYAVMPNVSNLQNDSHRLKFKAYATTVNRTLEVGYFADFSDFNSFVILDSFLLQGTAATTATEFTSIPANIPAGVNNLVFRNKPAVGSGVSLLYIDNVIWEEIPNCLNPTDLSVSSITSSTADLSWQIGGSEFEWEVEWGPEGFTQGNGTLVQDVFLNLVTITGLASNTSYSFYVRAVCGPGDLSPWAGPFTFTSGCGIETEYATDFEPYQTGITFMPNCWLAIGNGSTYLTTGSVAPMSPSKRLFSSSSATTPSVSIAALPEFSNLQANTHRLRFKGYSTSANRVVNVGYLTDLSDAATFVVLQSIPMPSTVAASAQEFTVYPGALPAGITRLAIRNLSLSGVATLYFDDFVWEAIPPCPDPFGVSVVEVTSSSVQLQWNTVGPESAWAIEYGAVGFVIGNGTIVPANTNPFTVESLNPNTSYDFYIKAICNTTESSGYSQKITVKTNCVLLSEYSSDFEPFTTGTGFLPDCWGAAGNGANNLTTGSVAPMSPTKRYIMTSSTTAVPPTLPYAILPGFSNLSNNTHRLKFIAYSTSLGRTLDLGYFAVANDPSSFVLIEQVNLPGTAAASAQEFVLYPENIPADITRLVFRNASQSGIATLYFDDVVWEPKPSCIEPNSLVVSSLSNNTASIAWNAFNNETSWDVEYGLAGFTQGNGTLLTNVSTNPVQILSLLSNTTYNVYVRANCDVNDVSEWSNVLSFTTLCDEISTYEDDFETYTTTGINVVPVCWTRKGQGSFYVTTGSVAPMSPTRRLFFSSASTSTTGMFALLPPFSNIPDNTHMLQFKAYATTVNRTIDVGYFSDGVNEATFVSLATFNMPSTAAASALEFTYAPANVPTGVKRLVFRIISLTGTATVYLDDVKWVPQPSTAPECSTNLVSTFTNPTCGVTPVNLTWNEVPNALKYFVRIGTSPGANDVIDNVEVIGLSYSFASPVANTPYFWTVSPANNVGAAQNCAEQTFTTPNGSCLCIPVYTTGITDSDLISNVVILGTTLSNNTGTLNEGPSYSYFAGQPNFTASLNAGQQYTMQVANGNFGSGNVAVWIDYNNNELFEESERVTFTTTTMAINSTANLNFTLPCFTEQQNVRMRVRYVWSTTSVGSTMDPCESFGWGEAEDYDVTLVPVAQPTGNAIQTFEVDNINDATINSLVVNGTNVVWYASATDAANNTNPLAGNTVLVSGETYYAVSTNLGCSSASFVVTVTVTLSNDNYYFNGLSILPNPTKGVVNIQFSELIERVEVYNLVGQLILNKKLNQKEVNIDLSKWSDGAYLLKIYAQGNFITKKVIKQ